jgi:hypothetical protein
VYVCIHPGIEVPTHLITYCDTEAGVDEVQWNQADDGKEREEE